MSTNVNSRWEDEQVSAWGAMHMAAALADYIEKPLSALAGRFLSFLIQTGIDEAPLPF